MSRRRLLTPAQERSISDEFTKSGYYMGVVQKLAADFKVSSDTVIDTLKRKKAVAYSRRAYGTKHPLPSSPPATGGRELQTV